MVKATFSIDEVTAAQLKRAASRLGRPQSEVVRDAIRDYAARVGRLSEQERLRMLEVNRVVPAIPSRPAARVDAELRALRAARRAGGRRRQPA